MKKMEDIIALWKDWQPTLNYVAPYRIAAYHYTKYQVEKQRKPLFPDGEINDVFAMLANAKPAAIISQDIDDQKDALLMDVVQMVQGNHFCHEILSRSQEKIHIFSSSSQTNQDIKKAILEYNHGKLGLLLGYPTQAIKKYQHTLHRVRKKILTYGGGVLSKQYKYNKQYLYWFYRKAPEFKIGDNWFK